MIKTAIAFLMGCLLYLSLREMPDPLWFWLLLPVMIIAVLLRKAAIFSFLLGLLWTGFHVQLALDQRLMPSLAGQDIVVAGKIASVPVARARLLRFEFEPDDPALPDKVRLNWYHPPPPLPQAGEHWQLKLRLKPPRGMMNPGSFDYEGWLFSQGIGATGYVRQAPDNQLLSQASWYSINYWRQQLQHKVAELIPAAEAQPLIIGLTVGIRDQLSHAHWQTLRQTGTSHLLAISGLHIGLAAALGFFLFRWLWSLSARALLRFPAQQAGAVGGILFALFYALLAGLSIPTQRAVIMVTTVLIGLCLKRPVYLSHLLAFSLLLVLLLDPLSVISAGFWLSFGAVALILLTCSQRFPSRRWQWAGIHLWIAVGLTPLLILFFQQTSLVAPLANLLAVPLVSLLVVPLLLMAVLLLSVSETLAALILKLTDSLLNLLWQWLSFLAQWPLADWQFSPLPAYFVVLITLAVLVLLLPRGLPARWIGLFALLPLIFHSPAKPASGQFWFSLLDVGQGLAVVVETTDHVLVFDTGPRFSDSFNTGSAVVAPFLAHRGIKLIDHLIISHGDNDHIGGVNGLLSQINSSKIFSNDTKKLAAAELCQSGQKWHWDGVLFQMLQPFPQQTGSANSRSCVLKVSNADYTLLLTGDIDRRSERRLVAHYAADLKADVLVVPHHGSKTSSSEAFIDAVNPDFALFAVGYHNRYRFPAQPVVSRYNERAVTLLRTDSDGAILFKPEQGKTLTPVRWRQQAKRLWTSEAAE